LNHEMATDIKNLLELPKNGSKWGIVLAGINFLLVFGNVYLSNGYVAKPAYEADIKERIQKDERLNDKLYDFAVEMRGIKDHMQGDEKQDKRIEDHEARIRLLEKPTR